jgi:hypothetical protein
MSSRGSSIGCGLHLMKWRLLIQIFPFLYVDMSKKKKKKRKKKEKRKKKKSIMYWVFSNNNKGKTFTEHF